MNLDYNESYEIDWTLNNGTQSGNYIWTAYSTYNYEYLNLTGLPVGYHCVDAELFENGTSVDTDTICFQILSAATPMVNLYMYNTQITYGNTAFVDFAASNITNNETYTFHWNLNEQVSNLETLHSKQTVLTTGIQSPSKTCQWVLLY